MGVQTSDKYNVARNACKLIRRIGVGWKIPLDVYQYTCDDGSILDIHYIHPRKLLSYLLEHHPVVIFGTVDEDTAQKSLVAFWKGFKQCHETQEAFSLGEPLDRLLPVAVHGEEGRGKRRTNNRFQH